MQGRGPAVTGRAAGRGAAGRIDPVSAVLSLPVLAGFLLPWFVYRPNRIAPGAGRSLADAFGQPVAMGLAAIAVAGLSLLLFRPAGLRLGMRAAVAAVLLGGGLVALGLGATSLLAGTHARVGAGPGFWAGFAGLALLLVDALARMRPGAGLRFALLAGAVAAAGLLLASGLFSDLAVMAEYRNRQASFRQEAARHLALALGSFAAAVAIGLPLGVWLARGPRIRGPVLATLTMVQTVPSIALFGMLILPLAWVARTVPGAAALGVQGIGPAPAFLALLLYALLPITANTVQGILAVSPGVNEAAAGMGLTPGQRLARVEIPLALPAILAGARIVLVQNIGLATVGALIGAGGFGTFVFQGIGQTATDLILLGVLPVVALAFAASAALDAAIAALPGPR